MEKEAQALNFPFLAEVSEEDPEKMEVSMEVPEGIEVEEETGDDGKKEFVFKLDLVPGAESDTVEVLEDEPVEMDEKTNTPKDDWDWESGGTSKFLEWLEDRFKNIPKHSGQDSTGVERVLAYFQKLDAEISRAMRKDFKREIDASKAEEARSEIMKGMDRLIERLEKLKSKKFKIRKNKAAETSNELVKTADTTTTGRIVVTVPYLISNIARACIDATVSGGRDMEECFEKIATEYKLDKREKSQVAQLIKDMGYPIFLDRLNPFKKLNPSDNEVKEYNTQYYA